MKVRFILIAIYLLLTGCSIVNSRAADVVPPTSTTQPTMSTLPNPASAYCQQQGNTLEILTSTDGSQTGVCIFPDGSECDEWAYYRDECQPPAPASPTNTPQADSQDWNTYRNEQLGYSFLYPSGATLDTSDDPLKSLFVYGDGMSGETWVISHPGDREDYRPPQDVDLLQWLTDHYLLGENRAPDLQIAGMTAIHFRHEGSPQSTADDRFYIAHDGQLYMLLIGHSGEAENWELNDRFLQSFSFDQPAPSTDSPTPIPTAVPIEPGFYQGFWTYTHPVYGFSIMLPEDWAVEETTTGDPLMNGHMLILHPQPSRDIDLSIRMTFRNLGEEGRLWPTGVGQGQFISQGALDVAGQPARRSYLVCPAGQVESIWYQGAENQPNIVRGNMEFGFIYSYTGVYCQEGYSLTGKVQLVGELIIASLLVP